MIKEIEHPTFDGETTCPDCGVVICAYCQGLDPDCPSKHFHQAGCEVMERQEADPGGDPQ